jgi:hypothetical protein
MMKKDPKIMITKDGPRNKQLAFERRIRREKELRRRWKN